MKNREDILFAFWQGVKAPCYYIVILYKLQILKFLPNIFIKGKVIRKIKGFYYVLDENSKNLSEENIYECKLRGTLKVKNNKMNCIIGDLVEFDEKEKVIEKIEKRKNFL